MAKESVQAYVFFVTMGKVFIFHPSFKNPLEIVIPDTIIKDLEIKKTAELEKLITECVQQNKIAAGPVYLILSPDATIEKTIPTTTSENLKMQIEEYVKLAPFNHVGFTTVTSGKDTYLILVNRELFEGFQDILERLGFHVSAVTPAKTLGLGSASFNSQVGNEILRKSQFVFQNSFTSDPERMVQAQNNLSSDPRRNKKLLLLLIALGLLILVLGGLVVKMTFFPDKPPMQQTKNVPASEAPRATARAAVSATPAPSASASASLDKVRVQVLNASGETGLAQSTKDLLTKAGFTLVDTGNAVTITSDRIQIVFAPDTKTETREALVKAVSSKFPNPATRDGENLDQYDAVITLTDTGDSGT